MCFDLWCLLYSGFLHSGSDDRDSLIREYFFPCLGTYKYIYVCDCEEVIMKE